MDEIEDSVCDAIADARRRAVCQYLAAADDGVVTLEEVTTHVDTEERADDDGQPTSRDCYHRTAAALHHVHLPRLADDGILEYSPERRLIRPGPALGTAIGHIRTVRDPIENAPPDS